MKKVSDNVTFISAAMTQSNFGPRIQAFIIEAIRAYCEGVIEAGKPVEEPEHYLISPIVWYEMAEDIGSKIERRNEG